MRTRVKICGLTRTGDARVAVRNGADAVGLVFYPPSQRAVSVPQAQAVVAGMPPFVTVVGLFVDERRAHIEEILSQVRIDLLQFHGHENADDCSGHGRPWIKAVRMRNDVNLHAVREEFQAASALLLDAYRPGLPGGTGERFDWDRIPADLAGDIILAGGLDADNVEHAVCSVRPYAVDVSGGVERDKGVKDADKIAAFMRGVRRGDHSDAGL